MVAASKVQIKSCPATVALEARSLQDPADWHQAPPYAAGKIHRILATVQRGKSVSRTEMLLCFQPGVADKWVVEKVLKAKSGKRIGLALRRVQF